MKLYRLEKFVLSKSYLQNTMVSCFHYLPLKLSKHCFCLVRGYKLILFQNLTSSSIKTKILILVNFCLLLNPPSYERSISAITTLNYSLHKKQILHKLKIWQCTKVSVLALLNYCFHSLNNWASLHVYLSILDGLLNLMK